MPSFRLIHGTSSVTADAAAELVRTKLEMGGAGRLSFVGASGGRMRAHGFLFCNRSNETIRCLQNRAGPRASEPGCDRSDWLADFANRNRLWQHQRKWTNRRSEPIDPAEWPKKESYALCRNEEIGRSLVFQTTVIKIEKTGERIDLKARARQ